MTDNKSEPDKKTIVGRGISKRFGGQLIARVAQFGPLSRIGPAFSKASGVFKGPSKRLVAPGLIVVVGLGVLVGGWLVMDRMPRVAVGPCSVEQEGSLLYRTARVLDFGDNDKIQQFATIVSGEILPNPDHVTDQNCLYAVVNYYVYIGDLENAQASFARLEGIYDADRGFSFLYGQTASMETLRMRLDNLAIIVRDAEANMRMITPADFLRRESQ
jgi:hypothetical protein